MGLVQSKQQLPGGEKVKGLQLPGQSGKTRKIEERIEEYMKATRDENKIDDLNILLTSNSKLLVEQTTTRLNDDLGPDNESVVSSNNSIGSDDSEGELVILKNGALSWTSSSDAGISEAGSIALEIIEGNIDMIVGCAHPRRFKKIHDVIKKLEKSSNCKRKIHVWIDEAHKSIKLWKKYIDILCFSKVKSVTLVSATWDPIDKLYNIHRIPYEVTHPHEYRTLHECTWNIVESKDNDEENTTDSVTTAPYYIDSVLKMPEYKDRFNKPGTCWLMPGNSRTITHDVIAESLLDRGWNGLKLNGKEKALTIHIGRQVIDYTDYNNDKMEPKHVLAKLYDEYPILKAAPFFVTGLNCIKEGITFQGDGFMFDGAILPNISDASDAYQLACRLAGNLKTSPLYPLHTSPLIVTTSHMQKNIKKQENIVIFLPRILYEEGRTLPTKLDKNRAARGHVKHDPLGLGYRVFEKFDQLVKFLGKCGKTTTFIDEPNGTETFEGKHVCSVQSSRGAIKQPRYLSEVIDKIQLAYGGGGAKKRAFPCYLDVEKAPEGLVWVAVVADDMKDTIDEADELYTDESDKWLKLAKDYTTAQSNTSA